MKKDKHVDDNDGRTNSVSRDKSQDSSSLALKADSEGEEILSEEETETAKKINQAETERD